MKVRSIRGPQRLRKQVPHGDIRTEDLGPRIVFHIRGREQHVGSLPAEDHPRRSGRQRGGFRLARQVTPTHIDLAGERAPRRFRLLRTVEPDRPPILHATLQQQNRCNARDSLECQHHPPHGLLSQGCLLQYLWWKQGGCPAVPWWVIRPRVILIRRRCLAVPLRSNDSGSTPLTPGPRPRRRDHVLGSGTTSAVPGAGPWSRDHVRGSGSTPLVQGARPPRREHAPGSEACGVVPPKCGAGPGRGYRECARCGP